MEKMKNLLLRTAFACMACDGEIAAEEVSLIKGLSDKENLFGNIEADKELDALHQEINQLGKGFLQNYFSLLKNAELNVQDELNILRIAALVIQADNKIEYSEIKFFKVIRSCLNVGDEEILANIKEVDEIYLAQDIKQDYTQLYDNYFASVNLVSFNVL